MNYKHLVIILALVLMISPVMAFEFDNTGHYDEKTNTMIIKNTFLHMFDLDEVARITLISEPHVYVMAGKDRKIAEFHIENFAKGYSNVFKNLEFFNLKKNNNRMNKNFVYKFLNKENNRIVNTYEEVCTTEDLKINASAKEECRMIVNGTKEVEVFEWKNLKNAKMNKLPKGNITIGIFTEVKIGEYGEWIPTLFGIRIPQWASWSDSMNVGLKLYYKFDETDGVNVNDSYINNFDGTLTGSFPNNWTTGKINNGLQFQDTNSYVDMPKDEFMDYNDPISISIWIYPTFNIGTQEAQIVNLNQTDSGTNKQFVVYFNDISNLNIGFRNAGSAVAKYPMATYYNSAMKNNWTHIVAVYDGTDNTQITNFHLYINGALYNDSKTMGSLGGTGNGNLLGVLYTFADHEYIGVMDELGIWNRSLSSSEVSDLYNSGSGMSWSPSVTPIVTLSSPDDNQNFSVNYVTFNCTANISSDGLLNVSLWYDGSIISTVTNTTDSQTQINLSYERTGIGFGLHNWTCDSHSAIGTYTIATNRSVNITATAPVITWINPLNDNEFFDSDKIYFNCSATDDVHLKDINVQYHDIYTAYEYNSTYPQTSIELFRAINFSLLGGEGTHNYSCFAHDDLNLEGNSGLRHLTIDLTNPSLNLTAPENITYSDGQVFTNETNITINWSVSDTNLDSCWFYLEDELSTNVSNFETNNDSWVLTADTSRVNSTNCPNGVFCMNLTENNTRLSKSIGVQNIEMVCWNRNLFGNNIALNILLNDTKYKSPSFDIYNQIGDNYTACFTIPEHLRYSSTNQTLEFVLEDGICGGICSWSPTGSFVLDNITLYEYPKTYVTCSDNNYTINITYDNHILNFFSTDLADRFNYTSVTFRTSFQFLEGTNTYEGTVFETDRINYQYNFSYDNTMYNNVAGNLVYNGTSYLGTGIDTNGVVEFETTADIPIINNNTMTLDFYWEIILYNSTATVYYNSTTQEQNISRLLFTNCNATYAKPVYVNYTIYNEKTQGLLNASMNAVFKYSLGQTLFKNTTFSSPADSYFYNFCTNTNKTFFVYPIIELDASLYQKRIFTLYNRSYSNDSTTEHSFYLVNSTGSTNFIIQVVDDGLQYLEGYYVTIERFYPENNSYYTVINEITDEYGEFSARLISDTVKYRFTFQNPSGRIVKTTDKITMICSASICRFQFVIDDSEDYFKIFDEITDFESILSFDNLTNTSLVSWNDVTGDSVVYRLHTERILVNGTTTVCNTSTTLSSHILSCEVGDMKANYRIQFFRKVSGETERRISLLNVKVGGTAASDFGKEGLIWAFLLLFTLVGIGSYNPTVGVLSYLVGFIGLGFMGIIAFSSSLAIINIVLVAIFIWAFKT